MHATVYLLTGFSGTGKLTVATALAELIVSSGGTARVVDNHWISNPIFGLVEHDGLTPLPPGVWDRVGEVASSVLRTVEDHTPRDWHVIFTAVNDGVRDAEYVSRIAPLAETRGSAFLPVRLLCDVDENVRRIVSEERREGMKSVDPAEPIRMAALGAPLLVDHPNAMSIDITTTSPHDVAAHLVIRAAELPHSAA